MEWEEVHGYTVGDEIREQPRGLSRSAWKRDRRIVLNLLNQPHAFDLVKPPEIREPFDGEEGLDGRTLWGNGFGAPQYDEDGKLIDPDALVEQWKVDYYEFRRHSRQQVEKRISTGPSVYAHGGYYIDDDSRLVSTNPQIRSWGDGYDIDDYRRKPRVRISGLMLLAVVLVSVRNKLSGEFARSQPAEGGPRPEWPRLSFWGLVRSGSRSDSFRRPGRAECTEMHYSPENLTRKGAGLPLPLLLFTLASRPLLRSPGPGLSFRGMPSGAGPGPGP